MTRAGAEGPLRAAAAGPSTAQHCDILLRVQPARLYLISGRPSPAQPGPAPAWPGLRGPNSRNNMGITQEANPQAQLASPRPPRGPGKEKSVRWGGGGWGGAWGKKRRGVSKGEG